MIKKDRKLLPGILTLSILGVVLATAWLVTKADSNDGPYALDTLLRDPLIGVAPRNAKWSADAGTLAFTWNGDGGAFQDVWVYRMGDDTPRRITRHADAGDGGRGVSELIWAGAARIAYVLDGALHITDLDGNTAVVEDRHGHIRQLGLSPDGQQLSFVSGGAENRYLHDFRGDGSLWLRPAGAGQEVESRRIFGDDVQRTFVESYEWAADSRQIALLFADNTRVPERELNYYADGGEHQVYRFSRSFPGDETTRRRLGVLQTADGSVRWLELADDQYPIWNYGLSADGSRLFANTSNFVVKEHTIYVFDVATGAREVFYRFDDPQNVIPGWRAAWAPGDDGLIIQTDRDGFYHLYHQAKAGAKPRALTSGEWEIASFEVDSDHGQIYFVANESHLSERQLYRVSIDGGDVVQLTPEPGTWDPTFAPDFSRVALDFSSDVSPPDLYVRDLVQEGDVHRVTHSPRPGFEDYAWARVSYPEFESHIDGMKVYGRLSVPPDFDPSRRYPMIVGSVYADTVRNQWGRGQSSVWALDQHLVSRGYLVLKVNVRGSWGQGKKFSQGLIRDYGGIDTDDIESGVRDLIAEGFVDPARVGLWGNSYGGLKTLMSLFKKPGVYAAGIAGAPASNVWHAYPGQMWVMGELSGDDYPERYRRQSALYHSAGLEDPLMIIHGTRDPIVLYSDTIALTEKMIEQGKMFELVTLPAASHGWADDNPQQTQFIYRKMIDFFDRHLKAED
jgi:dipeptidyl-peptidase-4